MTRRAGMLFLLAIWCHTSRAQPVPVAKPFVPEPILPGGVVLSLYPADSPHLKTERVHEAERYKTTLKDKSGPTKNVLNIHNPSVEVHLVGDQPGNTGAAVIVAPGGGHQILWVGPEGCDFVPFFKKHGVSTIILRNRLRVDGYDPKTDAVNDAFQAIRLTARGGIPFGTWTDRYVDWFKDLGFLARPGQPPKAAADVEAFAKKPAR